MTKLIVLGEETQSKRGKPIEFESYLDHDLDFGDTPANPNQYKYVELICRDYFTGVDIMFAYDTPDDRGCGTLFIGKWNDGFVAE